MVTRERLGGRRQAPLQILRAIATPGLLPRTVQLCVRCRENPAGFWVSLKNATVTRRPWCLSCCHDLDQGRCDITPFGR
jgi:hypothetical protein